MNPRRPGPRAAVLALWLAALALCAWQIVRTPFVADLGAFLPSRADAGQQVLIEQIRAGAPARTLFVGIDGGDAAARAAASRALAATMRADPRFEQVANGEQDAWGAIGRWLFDERYRLSPAIAPERFTPEGLAAAIDEALSLLGTPAGAGLGRVIEQDPTGEVPRIAEDLLPPRAPRSEGGVWVSREGGRALLLATLAADGADIDAQAAALQRVQEAFAPFAAQGLVVRLGGAPVFAVDSRARIESEIDRLALWGTGLMCAVLLLAFASLRALAFAALPVATGVVAGIAAVGLGFGSVHGMTLGFGITLIGEAVDYAIYYLIQARGRSADGTGWRRWLAGGWPTMRLGLLTSVCGFSALLLSGFPGLRQLGLFSVTGLVAALLTTRYVLPVLMPDGAQGQGARAALGAAGRAAMRTLPRTRPLWWLLGAAALLLLLQRERLWETELSSLSPVTPEAIALDAALRAELSAGADGTTLVVVQAADAEAALQGAEAVARRLEPLVAEGVIAGFDSPARFLPSQRTQRERQAALPAPEALRAALAQATAGGPLPAARLEPFVAAVAQARARPPLTPEAVAGTPVAPLVRALLMPRPDGGTTALLPLQPAGGTLDAERVRAALQGLPSAQLLDIGRELAGIYGRYLAEAREQALLGAAGVLALLALALRRPRRLLAVVQPLLVAVLLCMGALALAGVPLGILHLVGLLLVVAVGSNYVLFFDLLAHGGGQADDDTLASLLLANLTTVLGFGLIASSSIPALSAIGWVVGPGALLALVLAAAFAPRPAAGAATPHRP
ncbi:MAG: MMPL family transporter [Betaproteobacteria bacterium]|nr:MMPL family transporter [Rubrivivax sp.]